MLGDALRRFAQGDFDLLGVGRMLVSNPAFVALLEQGRYHDLRAYRTEDLLTLA